MIEGNGNGDGGKYRKEENERGELESIDRQIKGRGKQNYKPEEDIEEIFRFFVQIVSASNL